MTNLDSILKSRDITLPTKVRLVKAMVFPVVMYGCESWTIKKADCQRVDAFELWCWRRLLSVPWTARRSNQFILKEISPGCSLVGLMLKLKLQYFGHLMWRADSLENTLMLGKIEGRRRRGRQRMRWLDVINIFRIFHPNAEEYTFSSAHGTFSRIDHILGHKSNLSKFMKIEILSNIFSDYNTRRLDINYEKKTVRNKNTWILNNTFLNN